MNPPSGGGCIAGVPHRRRPRRGVPAPRLLQAARQLGVVEDRLDAEDNNLFEGGFLGLDNIGPIDRSNFERDFPAGTTLEQSDASGWMAFYSLQMLHITTTLALKGGLPPQEAEDSANLGPFHDIAKALNMTGVWNGEDGFYYDQLRLPAGASNRYG